MPCSRQVASFRGVAVAMLAAALGGCGNALPDRHGAPLKAAPATTSQRQLDPQPAPVSATAPTRHDEPVSVASAPSSAGTLQQPDPQTRLAALEVWAAGPRESLDPVTYALVDADEWVRLRAQELLEQELARR